MQEGRHREIDLGKNFRVTVNDNYELPPHYNRRWGGGNTTSCGAVPYPLPGIWQFFSGDMVYISTLLT